MLMALVIVLGILIIRIPVVIAKNKNLDEGELSTITLLSWLGILLGITWVIALVFALVWQGNALSDVSNLDKLERISKLYKDKVISKKEYEAMKNKLLGIK
jgi:membrane protein CcdC involved in cytochrome C biogenesis